MRLCVSIFLCGHFCCSNTIFMRTYWSCEDILAGTHNFKECFRSLDYVLGLRCTSDSCEGWDKDKV